tara:strand:+ start:1495 stop:2874 length:1380 start_codon:yes stop_codon:yes gene_type:complete
MKKTVFIVISSPYYLKYLTNKSFIDLEKKYKVFYLFNQQKIKKKSFKIKNKIFYKLDKKSSIWISYFLHFLRILNHKKCKSFKATTEWYYPSYRALKQVFKQENIKKSFFISYLKISLKKSIMNFLSINFLSKFVINYFYKNMHIEDNLSQIFSKHKPDLVIYPTHSFEPEFLKLQKLSNIYKSKTFYIIDNWDNLTCSTYYEFKPNFIGVWGEQTKIQAVKIHNFNKQNVFLIGNCRLDNYFKFKKKKYEKFNQNYILFVSCKIRVDEIYYIELLNRIVRENKKIFKNTKIIYRLHPQDKNLEVIKKLDHLENVLIDQTVFSDKKVSYFKNDTNLIKKNFIPLVSNAKFLTGFVSSVLIESLILNKSYLVIAFKRKNEGFFNPERFYKKLVHYEGLEKIDNVKFSLREKQYEKMVIKMFQGQKKSLRYSKTLKQLDYFYHKNKIPYSRKILKLVNKLI